MLVGENIPSIAQEKQKFLSNLLFINEKSVYTFNHLKDKLKEEFENIDQIESRNEFSLDLPRLFSSIQQFSANCKNTDRHTS